MYNALNLYVPSLLTNLSFDMFTSTAEAAGTCLGLCARVVGDQVVDLIVPYVTQNIQVMRLALSLDYCCCYSVPIPTFGGVVMTIYLIPIYLSRQLTIGGKERRLLCHLELFLMVNF